MCTISEFLKVFYVYMVAQVVFSARVISDWWHYLVSENWEPLSGPSYGTTLPKTL